jgi:aubergine
VREGTCTPVSFKVGYENNPDFPLDAISELTYNQCYCYYNWTGSVRVPAPLQNANKFAKLYSEIGDDFKTEKKTSDLKSKLFYL